MNTLLLIAVLGQWTSAGWFADPPKPTPPVVKPVKPDPPPVAKPAPKTCTNPDCCCAPGPCFCEPGKCKAATVTVAQRSVESPPAAPAPPAKRQLWELKANDGTIYRMYEREELIALVTEHNRQIAAQTQAPASTAFNAATWNGGYSAPAYQTVQYGASYTPAQQYAAPMSYGYAQGTPMMFGAGGQACGPGGCH